MEEKGIALKELSCQTAAELPLLTCCRNGSSTPGVHPPEQPESIGGSSAPGVHCRSCRIAAEASAAAKRL